MNADHMGTQWLYATVETNRMDCNPHGCEFDFIARLGDRYIPNLGTSIKQIKDYSVSISDEVDKTTEFGFCSKLE